MASNQDIFSLRIVIADFYMEKPILGLDPCYSEFRGKEIKKVPIIRIFGSNHNGQKTCMHIHGIFPYFYIPFVRKDFESVSQALYQIAINIDKAINISLGQASSTAQHVFKVKLVKGIPFYGYHGTEHQFLKIFMFNPRFVRRAANLLHNGVILGGKVFHPHESHVPYILQFMIDFNLYGMSFLYVPLEIVKFRCDNAKDEVVSYSGLEPEQILNSTVIRKQSICSLEVDINSNFILNRFQLIMKSNKFHSNPGIASIWRDEEIRRQKLVDELSQNIEEAEIPPLEIPETQERPDIPSTESELFYRSALITKLQQSIDHEKTLSESLSASTIMETETINNTNLTTKEQRRTFNLKKILINAVYPEECTQEDLLTNASTVENHLSNQDETRVEPFLYNNSKQCNNVTLADLTVDENLVLSLTQQQHVPLNASLREEDFQLLEVLEQLEEVKMNEDIVDLDSSLAPLTQTQSNLDIHSVLLDNDVGISDDESGVENKSEGNVQDFSMVMDDIDEFMLKLTQNQSIPTTTTTTTPGSIPQIDGSDDVLHTPTKQINKSKVIFSINTETKTPPRSRNTPRKSKNSLGSSTRSPRNSKSTDSAKYAPLPVTIKNKSQRGNGLTPISNSKELEPINKEEIIKRHCLVKIKRSVFSIQKQEGLSETGKSKASITDEKTNTRENVRSTIAGDANKQLRRSKRIRSLDKTHITCSLTPRRSYTEKKLKAYEVEKAQSSQSKSKTQTKPEPNADKMLEQSNFENIMGKNKSTYPKKVSNENNSSQPSTEKRETGYENQNQQEIIVSTNYCAPIQVGDANSDNEDEEIIESDTEVNQFEYNSSIALNLKRLRENFSSAREKSPSMNEIVKGNKKVCNAEGLVTNNSSTPTSSVNNLSYESEFRRKTYEENNYQAQSSSSQTIPYNSPSVFSDVSILSPNPLQLNSPATIPLAQNIKKIMTTTEYPILTPLMSPPSYEEVLKSCKKLNIAEYEFQQPFYSDPADVTQKKEIGNTALFIPSKKLNDCPEFQSVLGSDIKGLNSWRKTQLVNLGGPEILARYRSTNQIREFCANENLIVKITPLMNAPSRHEANLWLKAREFLNNEKEKEVQRNIEEDSPIKVRRQKVAMMMCNEDDDDESNIINDTTIHDSLGCSLKHTPTNGLNSPAAEHENKSNQRDAFTPLTRQLTSNKPSTMKRRKHVPRKSLLEKLKDHEVSTESKEKQAKDVCSIEISQIKETPKDKADISGSYCKGTSGRSHEWKVRTSQNSDSCDIENHEIMAVLERSSFRKNLNITPKHKGYCNDSFDISSSSFNNTLNFKINLENLQQAKADIEFNYLTIIMLEVFVPTRGDLLPNPEFDEIHCIFYAIEHSIPTRSEADLSSNNKLPSKSCGYILVDNCKDNLGLCSRRNGIGTDIEVQTVANEMEAIQALIDLCTLWDADIFAGYEIEMASWGYIIERAKLLGLNIFGLLSRIPTQKTRDFIDEDRDDFTDLDIDMKLCGRILLDVWRLMRSEISLTSYTFENVIYHILHKRCPLHSYSDLTAWYSSSSSRWIVIEYYLERVRGTLAILEQLDLIGRTSEMAKLIGIQFYEVLSRGSQFRVESMMLRIAKPKNLVPLSPSVQQRAHMRAPEYLPLIMEPLSRFYADPVIVLDFQSLYPSMIIAYNYCFSTCFGRAEHLGQSNAFEFGASQLRISPKMLTKLVDDDLITISPCGVVFAKPFVREGILPRMLMEILDTRQMVKQSMKLYKSDTALQRVLHSRQLGLKLMANVTYGYTAANFSGRMPSVEVGDSVVAKGRETLERAIQLVESNEKWNVKVVYGDTDSMFVHVPGRNRKQAFDIGAEIAEAVTKANPHPVKLKLEKVYQPCILQVGNRQVSQSEMTKKRYVGYMYETPEQTEPIYEAKGIETVRRDGCPAVAKILEKILRILFESADVSKVKQYLCRQFTKLLSGHANLQDLIFAKEFRGLKGYKPTACVPALELTRKWIEVDPRRIPRRGERVPFVIVNGPPGVPLIRLVRSPQEVLANEGLKINAIYYITKAIIPPLNRCLLLIGADANEWFTKLPRKMLALPSLSTASEIISNTKLESMQIKKSTISQYFSASNCVIDCGRHTKSGICNICEKDAPKSCAILSHKIWKIERAYHLTQQICQTCCGRIGDTKCGSLDCPVLYVLEVKRRDLKQIEHFRKLLEERF